MLAVKCRGLGHASVAVDFDAQEAVAKAADAHAVLVDIIPEFSRDIEDRLVETVRNDLGVVEDLLEETIERFHGATPRPDVQTPVIGMTT